MSSVLLFMRDPGVPLVVITRFIRVIQLFAQLDYRDKPGNDTCCRWSNFRGEA